MKRDTRIEYRVDGPATAPWTFLFAHGAGAGMDSAFMGHVAERMALHGIRVVRFEFTYMQVRRETGRRRPPNPMPLLLEAYAAMITEQRSQGAVNLAIGGKSMGGRVASMLADEADADGLVCFGYPFHPAGKPDKLRIAHLQHLECPALILQGERDTLGNAAEVNGYNLDSRIQLCWLQDGDHSFKPRKASGFTEQDHWDRAADRAAVFILNQAGT